MLRTTLAVAFAALVLLPGACSANSAKQIQVSWSNAEDKKDQKEQLTCGAGETKECRGATVGGKFAGTCTCNLDGDAAAAAAYKDGCRLAHGLEANPSEDDLATWWDNDAASGTQCKPKTCGPPPPPPREPLCCEGKTYLGCYDFESIGTRDISRMTLPHSVDTIYFTCEGMKGDVSQTLWPPKLEKLQLVAPNNNHMNWDVTGDVSQMALDKLTALKVFMLITYTKGSHLTVTGDVSQILLPPSMEKFQISGTDVTGDVSNMDLSEANALQELSFRDTAVSGDVSMMDLPASLTMLDLRGTTCKGGAALKKKYPGPDIDIYYD